MALSNITVKGITPDLTVLGGYQRFRFDTDALSKLQSFNLFSPTDIFTDGRNCIELRNYRFSGYRFQQTTHFDELDNQGTFKFQYFLNDGDGVDIWGYNGVYLNFDVPVQLDSVYGNLDMGGYLINNLGTPASANDAATKAYVDSVTGGGTGAVSLSGDVTGSGVVGSPIATTLTLRLDQIIAPTSPVSFNSQRITNLSAPSSSNDAANKSYVDGKTWTSSQITDFSTAVTAFRLDQFAAPLANVSMGGFKITNLATPISTTDATTKAYVDSAISAGTITLTGHVTGSGVVGTSFATTLTLRLDQITAPSASVSLNSQRITSLATPVNPNDAANMAYVDSAAAAASLPTNYYPPNTFSQNFIYTAASGLLRIKNEFVPGVGFPSNANLDLINSNSYGFRLNYTTTVDDPTYGVLNIQSIGGAGTTLLTLSSTGLTSLVPFTGALYTFDGQNSATNTIKLVSAYTPTVGFSGNNNIDMVNASNYGYRISHISAVGDTYGALNIQSIFGGVSDATLISIAPTGVTLATNLDMGSTNDIVNVSKLGIGVAAPHGRIHFDNTLENRKIILYETANNLFQFMGFGVTSGVLEYHVNATASEHLFYAAASSSSRNELFRIKGDGSVSVPDTGKFGIGVLSPHAQLHFDNTSSNRKIALYEGANNDFQFKGFGTGTGALIYSVDSTSSDHVFVAAASSTTYNELMRVKGNGIITMGGLLYRKGPFGSIYFQGNSTYTYLAAGTWAKVAGTTSNLLNLATSMPTNGRLTYTGTSTSTAIIHVTGNVTNNPDSLVTDTYFRFGLAIFKNGTQVVPSSVYYQDNSSVERFFSLHCPVSLTTNDYVELWHICETHDCQSTVKDMTLTLISS
jgi:hypothetical protein